MLKGILPTKYFQPWCVLVECISLLLGESISLHQLDHYSDVLCQFVVQHVSYNVHLLLYLVKSVNIWGPLWAHSAFLYESYNGCLLEMIKGTQGGPHQIFKKMYIEKVLPFVF